MSIVAHDNIVFVPIMKVGVPSLTGRVYAPQSLSILNELLSLKQVVVCSRAPNYVPGGDQLPSLSTTVGRVTSLDQHGDTIVARLELFDATLLNDVRAKSNVQFTTATLTRDVMVDGNLMSTPAMFICVYAIDTAASSWRFPNGEWASPTTDV